MFTALSSWKGSFLQFLDFSVEKTKTQRDELTQLRSSVLLMTYRKPMLKTILQFVSNNIVVVQSLSCVQLFCDPMNCSPPGSSVYGISQARVLEWAAISFPRGSSNPGIKPKSPALQAYSLPLSRGSTPNNTNHYYLHSRLASENQCLLQIKK